jgi:hypothetical protein
VEYKGSQGSLESLAEDVEQAASAFWNTGGGLFVAGVNGRGEPDGGINSRVGRQPIRDWIDQAIRRVEPRWRYAVGVIEGPSTEVRIESGKAVVAVGFAESLRAPHMASDGRCYIRAGAHTEKAPRFIVESLRGSAKPLLNLTTRLTARIPDRGRPSVAYLKIELYIKNDGGAVARFPCLTIATPTGPPVIKIESGLGSSALPKGTAPIGWWKRAAGRVDHIHYPEDIHYAGHLTFHIDRDTFDPDSDPIQFRWTTSTANGPPNEGELLIPTRDILLVVEALV